MLTLTQKLYPQPTLSLFLGGSGILVGDHHLTMIESLPVEVRDHVEAFFIDSQEPALEDHARSRHVCYDNLDQFYEPVYEEFSKQRFPENLGISPVMNSSKGCGVTRIFGTASLVACRDELASLVDQALGRLQKKRRSATQPLQVFLTASACGGTGAGMILDAAALLRHFLRERGEAPAIYLFLIGPSVFIEDPTIQLRQDQRDRMRASTYALLKEIHHFAQGNEFASAYRLRDQHVFVGNKRDDDRLFDWVYFLDGHAAQAGTTRSLDEVAWTIAEAQIHLCTTEVGRKVIESMPNQREERVREYPQHYIHPDNREHRSAKELEESSRKTFLASFAVRNVRFPVDEIKSWFRWGWVREALAKALDRDQSDARPLVDQFDALLGYDRGEMQPNGILADLGLTREQLVLRLKDDADPARGMPPVAAATTPEKTIEMARRLLEAAEWIVADMKGSSSAVTDEPAPGDALVPTAALLARALPRWKEIWAAGLAGEGRIAARLWALASDPASGCGLRYLDAFLRHATDLLTASARARTLRPGLGELEERVAAAQRAVQGLEKTCEREKKSTLAFLWRRLTARLKGNKSAYSEATLKKTRGLVQEMARLRQELIAQRRVHIADALTPHAWVEASLALNRWRDDVLAPAITAAENAFTLADNEWKLARKALVTQRGTNARGPWKAHTTVQIADDELLAALGERLSLSVRVKELVLVPLESTGIAREETRLTLRTLAGVDGETAVNILFAHVDEGTRGALAFLDNAWMLTDVATRLERAAAQALDMGAEPLLSFSRPALGQPLQSYLIKPPKLILPVPFGQRLDVMNAFASRDPLQLGVVSFVFGIPPNTLEGMEELFQQYAIHLGDPQRYLGSHDRYPLHIFRDAAETFDEPHSPPSIKPTEEAKQSVLDAGRLLWSNNGGLHLDIRELDPNATTLDWNRYVEMVEKILHYLVRNQAAADRLFANGAFADLHRLYNKRKFRAPETWTQ